MAARCTSSRPSTILVRSCTGPIIKNNRGFNYAPVEINHNLIGRLLRMRISRSRVGLEIKSAVTVKKERLRTSSGASADEYQIRKYAKSIRSAQLGP